MSYHYATLEEAQSAWSRLNDKFLEPGWEGEIAIDDHSCVGLINSYKATFRMPNTYSHGFKIELCVGDKDIGYKEEELGDLTAEQLMYLKLLKVVGTKLLRKIADWYLDEMTDKVNFFRYYQIFQDKTLNEFHDDERLMVKIGQAILTASKDQSFRIHYDKKCVPFANLTDFDVDSIAYEYQAMAKKFEFAAHDVMGNYYDNNKLDSVTLTFGFDGFELAIDLYSNEIAVLYNFVKEKAKGQVINPTEHYKQLIKTLLVEKMQVLKQSKTLTESQTEQVTNFFYELSNY